MMDGAQLQRRAKRRLLELERQRRDPRYRRVLARLVGLRLLDSNESLPKYRGALRIADMLWVGQVEPRVLELLPALLVRRPGLFSDAKAVPEDLLRTVNALRRNEVPSDFRGSSGEKIYRWLGVVGRKSAPPSRLKAFRLQAEDLELLSKLRDELGITETSVLRRGLRALAAAIWLR